MINANIPTVDAASAMDRKHADDVAAMAGKVAAEVPSDTECVREQLRVAVEDVTCVKRSAQLSDCGGREAAETIWEPRVGPGTVSIDIETDTLPVWETIRCCVDDVEFKVRCQLKKVEDHIATYAVEMA